MPTPPVPIFDTNSLMRAVLALLPEATFDTDIEGQIIIYTNLSERPDSQTLVRFDPDAWEQEALDAQ